MSLLLLSLREKYILLYENKTNIYIKERILCYILYY